MRKYYGMEVSDRAVWLRIKDLIIKYRAQQEGSRFREPKSNELKDLLYDNSNMFWGIFHQYYNSLLLLSIHTCSVPLWLSSNYFYVVYSYTVNLVVHSSRTCLAKTLYVIIFWHDQSCGWMYSKYIRIIGLQIWIKFHFFKKSSLFKNKVIQKQLFTSR